MAKKSLNPFKMWGSYLGGILFFLFVPFCFFGCGFLLQLWFRMLSNLDFRLFSLLLVLTIVYFIIGFIIGYAIHILIRWIIGLFRRKK